MAQNFISLVAFKHDIGIKEDDGNKTKKRKKKIHQKQLLKLQSVYARLLYEHPQADTGTPKPL